MQTRIADYAADRINSDYKTDIRIKSVALTLFGGVKFREVMIRDHHKDTLVFANRIQTNILSFRKLYNGDLLFGDISVDGMVFNLRNYKGEPDTNLDVFIAKFDEETPSKPSGRKFLLEIICILYPRARVDRLNGRVLLGKDRQHIGTTPDLITRPQMGKHFAKGPLSTTRSSMQLSERQPGGKFRQARRSFFQYRQDLINGQVF